MRSITKKINWFFWIGILSIFIIWMLGALSVNNSFILPDPLLTFKALGDLIGQKKTYIILGYSLSRLLTAIILSFIIAILTGSISIISKKFADIISPWVSLLKTVPLAVVIILFLIYFKANLSVYFIVGVMIYPIVYEGFVASFKTLNQDLMNEIKMLSNVNGEVIRKVILPITMPHILTTIIQSFGLGLKVLVMAEYIAQPNNSIGKQMVFYKEHAIQMEYVFAWALIIIVLVIVVELVIKFFQNKIIYEIK